MAQSNINMEITGMTIEQSVNTTPKVTVNGITNTGDIDNDGAVNTNTLKTTAEAEIGTDLVVKGTSK